MMDAAFERRVMRLHEAMLDQPEDTRHIWLERACTGDAALLEAVRALSATDRRAGLIPTIPPHHSNRNGVAEAPPERIGPYRIEGELGRGGMGTVYRGRRDDGLFEHGVAIKLIHHQVFSTTALRQFSIERQILARLHHPHIAQILDGGVTTDGDSYIIMELIEGAPITDAADAHGADLAKRLTLFREVAGAVDHAHRNLVVHADLKPSNVIVADDFGVKLLDFGIARLLGESDGPAHGAFTPGYASPARTAGAPPIPADDIFALGVLLRELTDEIDGTDSDLLKIAAHAAADDAEQRYGTIGQLVDDIDRWERHEPIVAVPAGRLHRARLYWRRNRLAVSLTGLILLGLLATVAVTTSQWLRAERERALAERRYEEARGLSRYLIGDITTEIAPLPGSAPIRARIAAHAEQSFERLGQLAGNSTQAQLDSAASSVDVGEILVGFDGREGADPVAARAALDRAEASLQLVIDRHPKRGDLALQLARALIADARFNALISDDAPKANALVNRAERALQGLSSADRRLAAVRDAQWDVAIVRAIIRDRQGDYAPNIPLLRTALAEFQRSPRPADAAEALRLERTLTMFADAEWYSGHREMVVPIYQQALDALSAPGLASDARIVARTAFAEYEFASSLAALDGHHEKEALPHIKRGLAAAERLRSFDATPQARHIDNIMHSEYGAELATIGRYDQAIAEIRLSIRGAEALAALQPDSYDAQRAVPVDLRPLAEVYLAAGHKREACAAAQQELAMWSTLGKRWHLGLADGRDEEGILTREMKPCKLVYEPASIRPVR